MTAANGTRTLGSDASSSSRQAESHRVLVVEDEKRLREMLLASLQEIGMTPTGAPTAEAALRLLGQGSFAVALIDLNLPGMGGMECFEIIHRRWPAVQVIVLTGFGDIEAAKRAIRLDVVDFLTKPCGMNELEVALGRARQRWLDRWMSELQQTEVVRPPPPREVAVPMFSSPAASDSIPPPHGSSVEEMEKQLILAALERHHGNREAAAEEIGISVRKLYYRLQQYQRNGWVAPK